MTQKKCDECGKLTEWTTTCSYPNGDEIELCPTCLRNDGSFCLSCGHFCAGMESFDIIHPGYCDNCWEEMEDEDHWEDEEDYPDGIIYP